MVSTALEPLKELISEMMETTNLLDASSLKPIRSFKESTKLKLARTVFIQSGEGMSNTITKFTMMFGSFEKMEGNEEAIQSLVNEVLQKIGTVGASFFVVMEARICAPLFKELKGLFLSLLHQLRSLIETLTSSSSSQQTLHSTTGMVWRCCEAFSNLSKSNQKAYKKALMGDCDCVKDVIEEFEEYLEDGNEDDENLDLDLDGMDMFGDETLDFEVRFETGSVEKELVVCVIKLLRLIRGEFFPIIAQSLMRIGRSIDELGEDCDSENNNTTKEDEEKSDSKSNEDNVDDISISEENQELLDGMNEKLISIEEISKRLNSLSLSIGSELYPPISSSNHQLRSTLEEMVQLVSSSCLENNKEEKKEEFKRLFDEIFTLMDQLPISPTQHLNPSHLPSSTCSSQHKKEEEEENG